MQFDWTVVVNDLGVIIGVVGAIFGINKKYPFVPKAVHFLEQNAGAIVQEAEAIGKAIVSTPAGAIAAHSLHVEVDRVTESFKKSEIARLALVGLHSFGQALGSLSDTQKAALSKFVVDSVPADWGVTSAQVLDVLNEVQKAANSFAELEIVKAANFFTDAQKASIKPATTDPQPTTIQTS